MPPNGAWRGVNERYGGGFSTWHERLRDRAAETVRPSHVTDYHRLETILTALVQTTKSSLEGCLDILSKIRGGRNRIYTLYTAHRYTTSNSRCTSAGWLRCARAARHAERPDARRVVHRALLQVIAHVPDRAVVARVHRSLRVVLPAQRAELRGLALDEHRLTQDKQTNGIRDLRHVSRRPELTGRPALPS